MTETEKAGWARFLFSLGIGTLASLGGVYTAQGDRLLGALLIVLSSIVLGHYGKYMWRLGASQCRPEDKTGGMK